MIFETQSVRIYTIPQKSRDGGWSVDYFVHQGALAVVNYAADDMREIITGMLGPDRLGLDDGVGTDVVIGTIGSNRQLRGLIHESPRGPCETMLSTDLRNSGRGSGSVTGYVACYRTGRHRYLWVASGRHAAAAGGAALWAVGAREPFPPGDDPDAGPGQGPFVSALVDVSYSDSDSPRILKTRVLT